MFIVPFTRTVSVTIKFYHCANGDGLFDRRNGSGTHSVHQCNFYGDGDGTCKRTLNVSNSTKYLSSLNFVACNLCFYGETCDVTLKIEWEPN